MYFRPRFGYRIPYAGAGFARLLRFLVLLLLLALLLVRAFLPRSSLVNVLWTSEIVLLSLSGAFVLVLLLIGPWQNRLAAVWLGIVVGAVFYFMHPLLGWAARLARMV